MVEGQLMHILWTQQHHSKLSLILSAPHPLTMLFCQMAGIQALKNSALCIQPWQPDADPLIFYINFLFSTLLLGSSYYSLPHSLKKIMPHVTPHRKVLCLSWLIYDIYEIFRHGLYKVLKSL